MATKVRWDHVLGWSFGLILILYAVSTALMSVWGGLAAGVGACLCLPPVIDEIEDWFQWRPTGKQRVLGAMLCVFVLTPIGNLVTLSSGADEEASKTNTPNQTLKPTWAPNRPQTAKRTDKIYVGKLSRGAWKLAVIDSGGMDTFTQAGLQPYTDAMDRLVAKCPEDEERLADFVVTGVDILRKKGVKVGLLPNLKFLKAMDLAMIEGNKEKLGVKCQETAAILATMVPKNGTL